MAKIGGLLLERGQLTIREMLAFGKEDLDPKRPKPPYITPPIITQQFYPCITPVHIPYHNIGVVVVSIFFSIIPKKSRFVRSRSHRLAAKALFENKWIASKKMETTTWEDPLLDWPFYWSRWICSIVITVIILIIVITEFACHWQESFDDEELVFAQLRNAVLVLTQHGLVKFHPFRQSQDGKTHVQAPQHVTVLSMHEPCASRPSFSQHVARSYGSLNLVPTQHWCQPLQVYAVDIDEILARIRFPQYLEYVGCKYGEQARAYNDAIMVLVSGHRLCAQTGQQFLVRLEG